MAGSVQKLTEWFDDLSTDDKKDVVKFLYGGKVLVMDGMYTGPAPGSVQRGLHVGPIPSSSASTCPTCGKPW